MRAFAAERGVIRIPIPMVSEEFGTLKHRLPVAFNGGIIEPLDNIEDTLDRFAKAIHPDGFYYPPTQHTVSEFRRAGQRVKEVVPQSERPAHLYWIPATHRVTVASPIDSNFKRGDAGFLIHLAGYFWGTRVQFADWQVDGRVPFARPTHGAVIIDSQASPFFSIAYDTWKTWSVSRRRMMANALYIHSKAPSYEWIWEQFLVEYMVFDNLWKQLALSRSRHSERIEQVCGHLGMDFDAVAAGSIVDLRNSLIHEGVWEGDTPGFAITQHGWDSFNRLRSLNHKVIAASVGWTGQYIGSSWADCSMSEFFD